MKRLLTILAALATLTALSVAVPLAGAAAPPRAVLTGQVCQTALDPAARAVSVTAVMRPVTGTQKLAVEFQLLERTSVTAPWTAVTGSGLGVWVSPTDPATLGQQAGDVWYVKKPVADLAAPAAYRFGVSFRWLGSNGAVLQTVIRESRICRQPELRPDLAVQSISVAPDPSSSTSAIYTALIQNLGQTAAGAFTVQLSQAGNPVAQRIVAHLAPHASVSVRLVGPACDAASPPSVTVDPRDLLDVSSRDQATLSAQCTATTDSAANAPAPPPPPGSGAADGIPISG